MGAGGVGGDSFEFIGSTWQTSTTTALLSEAPQAGDIILFLASSEAATSMSFPASITSLGQQGIIWNGDPYYLGTINAVGYKVADGTEGTTISGFSFSASGFLGVLVCRIATAIYRPSFSISSIVPTISFYANASAGGAFSRTLSSGSQTGDIIAFTTVATRIAGYTAVSSPSTGIDSQPPLAYDGGGGASGVYMNLNTVAFNAGEAEDMTSTVGDRSYGIVHAQGFLTVS